MGRVRYPHRSRKLPMKSTKIRIHPFRFAICAILMVYLAGCAIPHSPFPRQPKTPDDPKLRPYKVNGRWYHPIPNAKGFSQKGLASWYGPDFHGKKTANGEVYDMYQVSAAHKTLPLGTYVNVKNQINGKEVVVRINDRGPFVGGRIIDLSYGAAKALNIVGPGTVPVKICALGTIDPNAKNSDIFIPVDYYSGNFVVQVGAFRNIENARRLIQTLSSSFDNPHFDLSRSSADGLYRVRVGKCNTLAQAESLGKTLAQKGYPSAFVVAE